MGAAVTGDGIPADSVIVSIDSSTQVTINNNATASATVSISFDKVPGGLGDKVRVLKSTDGTTWTEIVHFNVGSHTMRHFHCIKQDPYTGYIYLGFGDTPRSRIIRWDPATGVWSDNAALADLIQRQDSNPSGSGPGIKFMVITLVVSVHVDYIFWTADAAMESGVDTGGGMWRPLRPVLSIRVDDSFASLEIISLDEPENEHRTHDIHRSRVLGGGRYRSAVKRHSIR